MVASGPVGLKVQTVFAVIPYVNIWAFYRIQKLRKMILLSLILASVFVPLNFFVIRSLNISALGNPYEVYSNPTFILYLIIVLTIQFSFEVYFVRRWTRNWNKKFNFGK